MDEARLPDVVQSAIDQARALMDTGAQLHDVLRLLIGAAEDIAGPGAASSILVLDMQGLLRNGLSPRLPEDYLQAIDRLRPDPAVGTCAAAAATGQVVVTTDFQSDAKWAELKHLPLSLGYRSAWSQPIMTPAGQVLGTFGTYFREQRAPRPEEREAVRRFADVAAQALAGRG